MTNDRNEGALMAQEQPIPFWPVRPFELVTVAVLRGRAWRWLTVKQIVTFGSASEGAGTTERNVRRLLDRLESVGVVRKWPLGNGADPLDFYQWNPDAPVGYAERLEEACADLNQAIGVANANGANLTARYEVPPVAEQPEQCPNGHQLVPGTVTVLQTGIRSCPDCGRLVM